MRHDAFLPVELTVQVSAQLPGGLEALGGGPAAPVAVGLRLLLGEIGHLANGLVHGIAYLYYTGRRGRDLGYAHPSQKREGWALPRPYRHIHFAAGLIGVEVGVCPQVDMN
jgi:hypothetical protein